MDHLNTPEGWRPQARDVPYLGLALKYDELGFDGFPERYNLESDVLISSHSILQWQAEWIESFIQEWLWFGLMDEFAKACDPPRSKRYTKYSIDQGSPCPLATLNPFGRELLLSDVFAGSKRSTRIERIL
jgi:hypothetical protein